jgi:hypothetical protein
MEDWNPKPQRHRWDLVLFWVGAQGRLPFCVGSTFIYWARASADAARTRAYLGKKMLSTT